MAISPSPSIISQVFVVYCFVATALVSTHAHANSDADQRALLAFRLSIKDPTNAMSNWNANTSFCSWNGVFCSHRRQRVVALDLAGMSLQGAISPHLANLSFLHVLNLSSNYFHGTLPVELGHLPRLKIIDLSRNYLEGPIPISLCLCHGVQWLRLPYNQFEGAIPSCLGSLTNLEYLSLYENRLSGSIPEEFGSLTNLNILDLGSNNLTGYLPENIGFMLPNLQVLSLTYNGFSGQIPRSLGNAVNLTALSLGFNKFTGTTIPPFLENLSKLEHLGLTSLGLDGNIPDELWNLSHLKSIHLADNNLTGTISPCLANLSKLEIFEVAFNTLTGSIPPTIGMLPKLKWLGLSYNNLTGTMPPSILNMSNLQVLVVTRNSLTGHLPHDLGSMLPNLHQLLLSLNSFHGQIPASLANATRLEKVSLGSNKFSGPIPLELGTLVHLQDLSLTENFLTNIPDTNVELSIITALTKCRLLKVLDLGSNSLSGNIPTSVGNFSSRMKILRISHNQFRGTIPEEITNLTNLYALDLNNNNISGIIPSNIGRLHNLQGLFLKDNRIEGLIPPQFYQMVSLVTVGMSGNMLSGPISCSISNMSNLQNLGLHANSFSSTIPPSFWQLKDLGIVYLQENSLTGFLPLEIGNLDNLYQMDLSANKLFGDLPASLVNLQMLEYLNLSKNSFSGQIPEKLDAMVNLKALDLSYNSLSGEIPKAISLLRSLESLNLSFNQMEGEIPSGGIFANLTADSFVGNSGLCGALKFEVPPCPNKNKQHRRSNLITTIVTSTLGCCAFIFLVALALIKSFGKKVADPNLESVEPMAITEHPLISYRELLSATNNFNDLNLIGSGSFGSVYKGILSDGTAVAVKVFNLQFEGILNSFKTECEVMSKARHRNLLKVISSCTNEEFKALVLQYMPRGSLENCLYVSRGSLNLLQRLDIMIDVACAMEYLHHDFFEPVLHCDLKPGNALLDSDMVAYVADFGIAKMLVGSKSSTLTETVGTTGYIAPEFGLGGKVSTKADVYSYGVVLLETLTRKKPTDAMFAGELSLTQWVAEALPDAVLNVVDGCLLDEYAGSSYSGQREALRSITRDELLVSILRVGLLCTTESPAERTNMRQVVADLKKIREKLIRNSETANMARNVPL